MNAYHDLVTDQQCSQREAETADQFITSLYSLVADCEFGQLKE